MKHNMILSAGLLSGAVFLSQSITYSQVIDQESKPDSAIYVIRYIDVDRENAKEFENAVAEKTKKFNRSRSSDQWFTAKILTGPRTGQYARWFGPKTWADLDKSGSTNTISIDQDNEELKYWIENVQPLAKQNTSLA